MTGIPEDIMAIANEIVDRIAKVHPWKGDCVADVAQAILAERKSLTAERDRLREENDRFRSIMQSIKTYGELACVDVDRGFLRPSGKKPATKDVWQFPRHMLTAVDAALGGSNAD